MEIETNDVKLEICQGDISAQEDITAVVNAANAQLRIGGGVAGAIHRTAGPGLEEETGPLAPIKPGEAVITGGHSLPNDYVIHVLGPVYGRDKPEAKLLADCYRNALELAEEKSIDSIAFPAISTGAFGYPTEAAAEVAFKTILEMAARLEKVKVVRFVLYGRNSYDTHVKVLKQLTE